MKRIAFFVCLLLVGVGGMKATLKGKLCPDPKDFSPCKCHAEDFHITVKCYNILHESEIEKAFSTANFGRDTVNEFRLRGPLTEMTKNVFANISFIEVKISDTMLATINGKAFENSFSTLTQWSVEDSPVGPQFPFNSISQYKKLKSLELRNVSLAEMPIINSTTLIRLNLDKNIVNELPENSTTFMPRLKTLRMTRNYVQSIKQGAFSGHPSLEEIDLASNALPTIVSKTFADMPRIRFIGLSRSALESMEEDAFYNVPSMIKLLLDHNRLATLTKENLGSLPALKFLGLSYNNIVAIDPDIFSGWDQAHYVTIDLEGNPLKSLSANSFEGIGGQAILITGNKISTVGQGSFGDLKKAFLDLSFNNITSLEENWLRQVLEYKSVVLFRGNPLECECDVAWLVDSPQLLLHIKKHDQPKCKNGTMVVDLNSSYYHENC